MEVKRALRAWDVAGWALAIALPASVLGVWLSPRAVPPTEMPPLVLPGHAVRALIAEDRARAARAPDGELELRRRDLYRAQGRAELSPEPPGAAERRLRELHELLVAIARAHGHEAIASIRARDVERMIPALAGRGAATERAEELGAFLQSLERWGAVVRGRRVAPELVVRALFAARWNVVHGLAPTHGFGRLRLQAYHGWLALHAEGAPLPMRMQALEAYEAAAGRNAEEARALLAWEAGDAEAARQAFEAAHAATGCLRLRNHALAAALLASDLASGAR